MDDDVLRIDDDDRYGRFRLISWWRQERLAAAKVLVVGAGLAGQAARGHVEDALVVGRQDHGALGAHR